MERELTNCPCCGRELPLGLFAREAVVALPVAVDVMNQAGEPVRNCYHEIVLHAGGRWFVAASAKLPLDWDESPVQVGVWLEVERHYVERISRVLAPDSDEKSVDGAGRLACDVPGFPGTIGASASFIFDPAIDPRPRLRVVQDERLRKLHGHGTHDQLVELYRRTWGGEGDVVSAHPELRGLTARRWRELVGRPTFRKQMEPPPRLAGIQPAELLIAPPLDTGEPVFMATLGNAEANPKDAVEFATSAINPSDEFQRSFAEFCWWSRGTSQPLHRNGLLTDRPIPDTEGMDAWLLVDPWWESSWSDEETVHFGQVTVQLLNAIPIFPSETAFAREQGVKALAHALEMSEVDVCDLKREPIFVTAE